MKTIFTFSLVFFLVIFTSCKKELAKLSGKTCWKCHVYAGPNPADKDYTTTKCVDDNSGAPQFTDDYGNSLNADCTKQ